MKLYYSPGACSLSPHIILREAGLDFALERVDLATHKMENDADYVQTNPKGYVPALGLEGGGILTEGAAIVQYVADLVPKANLAPRVGTLDRARMQEYLNYIASELHKAFGPFFTSGTSDVGKQAAAQAVMRRLDHFEKALGDGRTYLLGEMFTPADAYLFVVASWTVPTGISLEKYPRLAAFLARVPARPKVKKAMKAESLLQ